MQHPQRKWCPNAKRKVHIAQAGSVEAWVVWPPYARPLNSHIACRSPLPSGLRWCEPRTRHYVLCRASCYSRARGHMAHTGPPDNAPPATLPPHMTAGLSNALPLPLDMRVHN